MGRPGPLQLLAVVIEFALAMTSLGLFGYSYPDRIRSLLWRLGGDAGWNSNPRLRIYFCANHREPPPIPFIWSPSFTESNLTVAAVSMAVWFARFVFSCLGFASKPTNVAYDSLLVAMWTLSIRGQVSSDLSDPDHLSLRPWYLERSCNDVASYGRAACWVAKASLAFSFLSLGFYLLRLAASLAWLVYRCGQRGQFAREFRASAQFLALG
ncbi:hypothetical protein NKR23_g908 [Pleurostoma richardsiae]|uniref:Uncharacterized protein n=1 Tax=Pleurostoma richardsiae TaxID=41990 RepID=A0AA38VWV4_9PEZI|nr:hypothetical protein NKR23_g908 [Pleurostoma richardsiae]